MSDQFQQRLVAEKAELDNKLAKLQASKTLETEQARWQQAIANKIAEFVPDVCADGCDMGDPLDWSLAEIGIALQTALETNQQASDPDLRQLDNTLSDYDRVDCRYQHTSEELKLVTKLLDVLNDTQENLSNDYGFEGSLDVFWAETISGRVVYDSIYGGWVYLPTARGEKPEKGGGDDECD